MRPSWSVVIPTFNRPRQLARCLDAVTRVNAPPGGFQVIVVNDGGSDFEADLVQRFASVENPTVRLLSQPHGGPGKARNHGAEAASGSYIAFTDDDCEPHVGWLNAFDAALVAAPHALAGGVVQNMVDSVFSNASQELVSFLAGWFDGVKRERLFTSNNIALSRADFFAVGGFDWYGDAAGEDRDFCDRWSAQKRPSIQVRDAIVFHSHALSWSSFVRQHFNYGRAGALFRRTRSKAARPLRVDTGFYFESLRFAGRVKPFARGTQLAALTAVAHVAYAAGMAREALHRRPLER